MDMTNSPRCQDFPVLATDDAIGIFDQRDALWALEWAATAPGIGGWNALLDDITCTRLISIIPPASRLPSFVAYRKHDATVVAWLPPSSTGTAMEMKRFGDLRTALLSLCALDSESLRGVDESVEILCSGRPLST